MGCRKPSAKGQNFPAQLHDVEVSAYSECMMFNSLVNTVRQLFRAALHQPGKRAAPAIFCGDARSDAVFCDTVSPFKHWPVWCLWPCDSPNPFSDDASSHDRGQDFTVSSEAGKSRFHPSSRLPHILMAHNCLSTINCHGRHMHTFQESSTLDGLPHEADPMWYAEKL